ncbi:MAG TPA: DMT family transporter [Thermomicrobiales bacterium]
MTAQATSETKTVERARLGAFVSFPALGAVLFWSGVAPFGKYALEEIPALAYTALRPVIAAAVLFGFLRLRRQPLSIARSDWSRFAVAGFGCMGASQLLFIGGLSLTSVGHNVILAATSPLLSAVMRGVFRREVPDRRTVLGLLAGFAGVVVIVSDAGSTAGTSVIGDLLSLGAALTWVGATVLPQPLGVRYGAPRTTAWLLLGSAALLVPIGSFRVVDLARNPPSTPAWLSLFYGGAIGMLGGNALWQRAVQEIGPARTLVYLYLEPVAAMILAALVLGERLTVTQGIGGVLALAGVALVRKG